MDLVAPGGDVGPHLVAFYDGVPGQGVQGLRLPAGARVAAGSPYRARTYFRPAPEGGAAAVRRQLDVNVTVDPLEAVETLLTGTRRLELGSSSARRLLAALEVARQTFQHGQTAAVVALTGKASRVGDVTDNGQVRIEGAFTVSPPDGSLHLARATVRIESVLAETGGAGEPGTASPPGRSS